MRVVLFSLAIAFSAAMTAQTVTSVQDGLWNDTATWDCGCVPAIVNVEVVHVVQITSNIILFMQQVHVSASGSITMDGPHSVAITETVINDGIMQLIGDIDVDGQLIDNGQITINGDLHNDNTVFMGGAGALLQLVGSFGNTGTVDGEGAICVSAITQNSGLITGHIDLCDGSPTVLDPPFLDVNTGTVANTVTFCATGICVQALPAADAGTVHAYVDPLSNEVWMVGLRPGARVRLLDALGRSCAVSVQQLADRSRIDLNALAPGRYFLRVEVADRPLVVPLILIR